MTPDDCYRALCARDRRFDGLFFVGVTTTGIYCRPICPARTPGRSRCRFFTRAAEAEREGFRACFRCRPECAPGGAPVDAAPRLVAAALARIAQGALDACSVEDVAAELGVTGRHLRRSVLAAVGVSPVELAQTRRLGLARWLIQDTSLSMTAVAEGAGFRSLRRFNAAFRERFSRSPSSLRRRDTAPAGTIALRLAARPPFAGAALMRFLGDRAIPGVETVTEGRYRRLAQVGDRTGWLEAELDPERPGVIVRVDVALLPVLGEVLARVRALFDLDARPDLIDPHLAGDAVLRPLVARQPGLRVAGAFDPWELAVRAVLGQQVSVRAATTVSGRLVTAFGRPVAGGWTFPPPRALARASVDKVRAIGLTGARAGTIVALAERVASGTVALSATADPELAVRTLRAVPGIGEWTADYIAMRALRVPDIFLGGDLAVRRALGASRPREAEARAAGWRPWRAYGLMHLWGSLAAGG
jgi:AraC family transcriptional regulator of adaptative response / DNA-3-methyladenine glycosylase II